MLSKNSVKSVNSVKTSTSRQSPADHSLHGGHNQMNLPVSSSRGKKFQIQDEPGQGLAANRLHQQAETAAKFRNRWRVPEGLAPI